RRRTGRQGGRQGPRRRQGIRGRGRRRDAVQVQRLTRRTSSAFTSSKAAMPIETVLNQIVEASSLADCLAVLRRALASLDIDTFASGEVDLRNRDRSIFTVIEWPPEWRRFYFSAGLVER